MSEFIDSFWKWLGEKANSPLYWTYIGFFVAWNWRLFHVLFFEDVSVFGVRPRIEYIEYMDFFNIRLTGIWWLDPLLTVLCRVAPPAALTYLTIRYLPLLHNWAYRHYERNVFKRRRIKLEEETAYNEIVARLVSRQAEAKTEEAEQMKIIEEVKTQEQKWEEELDNIDNKQLLVAFQELVRVIYEVGGGRMKAYVIRDRYPEATSALSFAGTYGLIEIDATDSDVAMVKLSEKGKYFSRILSIRTQSN